jgi:hypothetical protein
VAIKSETPGRINARKDKSPRNGFSTGPSCPQGGKKMSNKSGRKMSEPSIQDNYVVSYTVLCEQRRLVLCTEIILETCVARTDLLFYGVEAYSLKRDNFGTILFSIDEVEIEKLLADEQEKFDAGTQFHWPGEWNTSLEESKQYLISRNCRGWTIRSSTGMTGFVIAQGIECRRHTAEPDVQRMRRR